jgi:hypothetical protein
VHEMKPGRPAGARVCKTQAKSRRPFLERGSHTPNRAPIRSTRETLSSGANRRQRVYVSDLARDPRQRAYGCPYAVCMLRHFEPFRWLNLLFRFPLFLPTRLRTGVAIRRADPLGPFGHPRRRRVMSFECRLAPLRVCVCSAPVTFVLLCVGTHFRAEVGQGSLSVTLV